MHLAVVKKLGLEWRAVIKKFFQPSHGYVVQARLAVEILGDVRTPALELLRDSRSDTHAALRE